MPFLSIPKNQSGSILGKTGKSSFALHGTPMDTPRIRRESDSADQTVIAQNSIREELADRMKSNYMMQFEAISQNMQTCIQVYNYKAETLEKRLVNLEGLLKSPTFGSFSRNSLDTHASVFEAVITRLNQSLLQLNELNNHLSIE